MQTRHQTDSLRRQQQTPEQREHTLQTRCENDSLTRQQQTLKQREHRLQTRRETVRLTRQQESSDQQHSRLDQRRLRGKTVENFKADILVSLDHCHICHNLVFADKAKTITSSTLSPPPDSQIDLSIDTLTLCSKCNTQITKKLWPSWTSDNALKVQPLKVLSTLSIPSPFPHFSSQWVWGQPYHCLSLHVYYHCMASLFYVAQY